MVKIKKEKYVFFLIIFDIKMITYFIKNVIVLLTESQVHQHPGK